ncbi:hypothetical protein M758_2G151400 [Ceratodon purpureus]|nr:hypothetical protein M758_2G151400 [Ceratodon purpureus]
MWIYPTFLSSSYPLYKPTSNSKGWSFGESDGDMMSRILSEPEGDVATEALETCSSNSVRPIGGEIRALETRRSNQIGCVSGYHQIVVSFGGVVCFFFLQILRGRDAGANMEWRMSFAGVIQKFSLLKFLQGGGSAFADGTCLCCVMCFVMLLTSWKHLHLCRSDKRPVLLPTLM